MTHITYRENLNLLTEPTSEPITLTEAKDHLRILSSNTDDDTYITTFIVEASIEVEEFTEHVVLTQT